MKKYIIFDLDGTLTDPALGITNSVMYALEKMGKPVGDRAMYYPWIGPPLCTSFVEFAGVPEEKSMDAVELYREYFSVQGLFENTPYPGIEDVLQRLTKQGAKLYVATSKPETFAVQILEHFQLASYFSCICGNTLADTRHEKKDVLEALFSLCPEIRKEDAVMVGDREFDVLGARAVGLPTIGVLYGYGGEDELKTAGAYALAKDTSELLQILMELSS